MHKGVGCDDGVWMDQMHLFVSIVPNARSPLYQRAQVCMCSFCYVFVYSDVGVSVCERIGRARVGVRIILSLYMSVSDSDRICFCSASVASVEHVNDKHR